MAALRRLNRQQRRAGAQLLTGSRAYIRAAAESLGFSEEELAEAQSGHGESADVLMARVFELLELQHGRSTPDCEQARAELERRRGAGFVKRVQRMGKPRAAAKGGGSGDVSDSPRRGAARLVLQRPVHVLGWGEARPHGVRYDGQGAARGVPRFDRNSEVTSAELGAGG